MLCERCGKKEASVHLTRIVNNKKEEIHLCEDCARKSRKINIDKKNMTFQSLLSGILNYNLSNQKPSIFDNDFDYLVCKNCGLSYQEFTQKGFFGCAKCFDNFQDELDSLFKRIHGNNRHTGKIPLSLQEKFETELEIDELKKEMQNAVQKENFERAAKIRDEINVIKKDIREDNDE